MSLSTFSGLYIAKSGVQASRAGLQITGQNMTNVNTEGYTKQTVDTYSLEPAQGNMRIAGASLQTGEGVICTKTSQSRDPYLDIRFREKSTEAGEATAKRGTLSDIENVFDETVTEGISSRIEDFISQLQTYSQTPTDSSLENTVKTSSSLLANAFNYTAKKLEDARESAETSLTTDVSNVNDLVKSIASYNKQIRSAELSGSSALEIKDKLNTAIDELSNCMNIKVENSTEAAGVTTVSKLTISLVASDGSSHTLVDGGDYNTLSMNANHTMDIKDSASNTVASSVYITTGTIGGYCKMLNDEGEFGTAVSSGTDPIRGIGYYEKMLDKLANQFAGIMNKQNSTDSAGTNKPLFESSDSSNSTITASNISVSKKWENAASAYLTTTKSESTTGTAGTDGSNLLSMINALSQKTDFTTAADNSNSGTALFTASVNSYMSTVTNTVLALQAKDVQREKDTADSELDSTDTERASVSSVDINEEGINMIKYNQAFSASSRFMTTINEMLDTLINEMGIV